MFGISIQALFIGIVRIRRKNKIEDINNITIDLDLKTRNNFRG